MQVSHFLPAQIRYLFGGQTREEKNGTLEIQGLSTQSCFSPRQSHFLSASAIVSGHREFSTIAENSNRSSQTNLHDE